MIDYIKYYSKFESYDELKKHVISEGKAKNLTEADKYIRRTMPQESYFQDKIIKFLKASCPESMTKKYAVGAYSQGGMPDILFIHKGRYIGFEVKRPFIGVVSALQKQAIEEIRRAGGVAEVISFPAQAAQIIMAMEAEHEFEYLSED